MSERKGQAIFDGKPMKIFSKRILHYHSFINIITQEVIIREIRNDIPRVTDNVSEFYVKFWKECLVHKSFRLSQTIHRNTSKIFMTIHKNHQTLQRTLANLHRHQVRIIEAAWSGRRIMEERLENDLQHLCIYFRLMGFYQDHLNLC